MIGETDMGVSPAPTLPEGECATGWLYAAVEPSSLHYQSDFDMFTSGFVTSTHVVSSEPCLSRVRVRLHRKDTPKPQVPMDPIPVCPYSQNAISSSPEPLRACIPYSPLLMDTPRPLSLTFPLDHAWALAIHRHADDKTVTREFVWFMLAHLGRSSVLSAPVQRTKEKPRARPGELKVSLKALLKVLLTHSNIPGI